MRSIDKMSPRELRASVRRLREALIAIRANSNSDTVSLNLQNRINAIHEISSQALDEEEQ